MAVAATVDTDAADTATVAAGMLDAAALLVAEAMPAQHAVEHRQDAADTLVELAVERRRHVAALAVAAPAAADSRAAAAMRVVVAATAAAADTGKTCSTDEKGPSASAGGPFACAHSGSELLRATY
jgi:hypothetical protein